ncbi:MAG TPA: 16S rRNA (cytosine(967)-C(5))-methyltransferase RsmB [Actinomycetota bacterium]|nr:16S rRNA (cytosine(967)-C(5))-methyltransferase RsmB [Actinomycetota bacterium]
MALEVIRRVTDEGAYSNLALSAELTRSGLPVRDRQFAAELALGTIRALLRLDGALAGTSSRPLPELDPPVRAALRLGAHQLLFTRVPAHAAVSETVGLVPVRARGFVNGVLRALAREAPSWPSGPGAEDVAARTGLAPWAVEELGRVLPQDEVEDAAAALASPAPLTLRVNTCRTTVETVRRALREAGHHAAPGRWHPDVLTLPRVGPPSALPGFRQGWFAVQDEASVLVGAAVEARPGERILDACAGPGGKASHLACAVGNDGVLVAGEIHARRAALVSGTAERLGVRALVLAQDARQPALRGGFDAVLVDAPCSGLGAARRRPELLWRPQRSDLARLARLQVAILKGVAELVRPEGRLVYAVCTYPRAETEAAVRAFLAKRPDFEPAALPGPDGPAETHRLWPHRHGTDAMFIAGFRRTD